MNKIDLVIPKYNHALTDDDYENIVYEIKKHKSIIDSINNDSLEFTGVIIKHSEHHNQIHGWILLDTKGRADDGETLITSPVKMRLQSEVYDNVYIVKTQNSKYMVIG